MYIIVPSALSYLAKFEHHHTVSGEQRVELLNMVCFFLVNLILLRALVESTVEGALLSMGPRYLDGEDCKKIEQYMTASFLTRTCLLSLAFLITSSFLGISFDLLAPIPWINKKLRKFRKNDMLQLVPEMSEDYPLENQDIDSLERPLIHERTSTVIADNNGFLHDASPNEIDFPGQDLSEYPPVNRTSPVPKPKFDFAQYYVCSSSGPCWCSLLWVQEINLATSYSGRHYFMEEPVAQGGLLPSLMANKADEVYGLSSTNSNSVLLQKTPTVGARLPIVGKISTCNNQGVKVDAPGFKLDDEATSHQQQVQEMEG
ncbi:hypothetical protein KY289_028814 [Solanum tuberosum]|nr:hypothetical protein KY289_028814 [Solanum tuberosum]KAH0662298.1 hypothetical protein KY284_027229 [Solanum tuberosum]